MNKIFPSITMSFSVLLVALSLSTFADSKAQMSMESSVDVNVTSSFQQPTNNFILTFIDPTTNTHQSHIDYDFSIIDRNTNETLYRGSSATGQQVLHTSEGQITIPYEFTRLGNYTLNVDVLGLHFMPIPPKTFSFPLTVSDNLQATIVRD